ncbi:MAG: endonuclease/exonuclease/phosphatase family protein [Acidobacteriota bacterium]
MPRLLLTLLVLPFLWLPASPASADAREADVWSSPEACEAAVADGARLSRTLDGDALAIGNWNIRWFPRGCRDADDCPVAPTDLDWLGCVITWMDVDVLALQEIIDTPEARRAMRRLRADLTRRTGGQWRVDLQRCGPPDALHTGFLWDAERVALSNGQDIGQLNGAAVRDGAGRSIRAGDACAGNLRPGRYAHVQSRTRNGVDLHLLSVHFDSGRGLKDYRNRRAATGEIARLMLDGRRMVARDADVVVVGDFNTMGMNAVEADPEDSATTAHPEVTGPEEIALMTRDLAPSFAIVPTGDTCSMYWSPDGDRYRPSNLDHVVATRGMREAATATRMTGLCAVRDCQPFDAPAPAAYRTLSDHCPMVIEVRDVDEDD